MPKTAMIHECDNCNWKGTEDELACCMADMGDFFERITPGCACPSGDCPECGACCYPLDRNERLARASQELVEAGHEMLFAFRKSSGVPTTLNAAHSKLRTALYKIASINKE